jgi:hypothetical protein
MSINSRPPGGGTASACKGNQARIRLLRADLRLGTTFVMMAQRERDRTSRLRLRVKAERAHDAVMRLLNGAIATDDERVEIELGLTMLNQAIRDT